MELYLSQRAAERVAVAAVENDQCASYRVEQQSRIAKDRTREIGWVALLLDVKGSVVGTA